MGVGVLFGYTAAAGRSLYSGQESPPSLEGYNVSEDEHSGERVFVLCMCMKETRKRDGRVGALKN